MQKDNFESRMENWRRTVLGSSGGQGGYCAGWAKLYVQVNAEERTEAEPKEERQAASGGYRILSIDVQDGWTVEACVREMSNEAERELLRYWYVFRMPEHWIRHRLMVRTSHIRQLRDRAITNLKKLLDDSQCLDKIPNNNFHAGNVPRQKTTVAHVGAVSSSDDSEASND